ncbi:hypothetical protein [Peribacillus sp. NPDC096540]|uniref:hypothetical protein n=1 Tax=Peribacillus sp. NPDC096540 TaxID=3390612 RepID=UPI003D004B2D
MTILISMKDPSGLLEFITKLKSILTEWDSWDGPPLRLGVGSLFHGIGHISRSYEEAIQSLKYLANRTKKA